MSQSPSSLKKLLDSLNEIDLVAFYTSLDAPSPSKILIISPVNIGETSPLNTQSSLDLNNEPSPCSAMLFDLLFEGDLPKNKSSESNILALGGSQPVFDQTPEFGVYPSSDSTDTDEDNRPLRWIVQKKMVHISTKGKEKVTEETPKRRPFTRSDSKKLMGDAMKSSATMIAERRKERKSGNVLFEIPDTDIVDVSIDGSENEGVEEDYEEKRGKQVKEPSKGKSRGKGKSKAFVAKRVVSKKGKNKRKRETSHVIKPASGTGPGPMENEDDHGESKQSIVNNLRLQKVLGGRVFDTDIITKQRMNSLYDFVEMQSWTHLFMTKSPVLHEEEVREFYYNIEFEEDGSITTKVGSTSLHMTEDLLGQILEKLMKGEYQLLYEFVNKVLLPRTEKRTVASASDLFIMESLCKFDPIDLSALMLEHMYKTVVEYKGKHGMGYGYFFTKANPLSKVSQLIMEHDQLKHELEEMTVRVSNKEVEIALLKVELLKAQTEGHGTAEVRELRKQNEVLLAKIAALQEKAIKDNDEANTRLTLIIKSLSHKPPSS
ncbi:hypothetical protein KY290_003876 [Solanum tuberosum]|uniref:Uncharacterized protein n=1 Tax=Solanum tuberosum TaxID=4113 RepID=A0ABQ7WU45_SOLTU|nr:hypothetical protein KY290_003876 [Solanum tuberosum]